MAQPQMSRSFEPAITTPTACLASLAKLLCAMSKSSSLQMTDGMALVPYLSSL